MCVDKNWIQKLKKLMVALLRGYLKTPMPKKKINTFDLFVDEVIKHEGGLVVDPVGDPGGTTKYGISLRFAGSIGLDIDKNGKTDKADIIALSLLQAKDIYFEHFWSKINGDILPRGIAFIVFDAAVNQGPSAAVKDLQAAVHQKRDGIMGDKTRLAAHQNYNIDTLHEICALRMKRYGLAGNFKPNALGWSRRLMRVHAFAIEVAKDNGIK